MMSQLLRAAPLVAAAAYVAITWMLAPAFSASAGDLLNPLAGGSGLIAPLGRLLRSRTLLPVSAAVSLLNLALAWALGRRLGGPAAWIPALLCTLGPSRGALTSVCLEAWLLLACQLSLLARPWMRTRPLLGATTLGLAMAISLTSGPAGFFVALGVALVAAFPDEQQIEPTAPQGLASEPIFLTWAAAIVIGVAALWLAIPKGDLPLWFKQQTGVLRTPAPTVAFNGLGDWPLIGPLLVRAGMLPAIALLAALRWTSWRRWGLWLGVVFGASLLPGQRALDTAGIGLFLLLPPVLTSVSRHLSDAPRWHKVILATTLWLSVWGDSGDALLDSEQSALSAAIGVNDDPAHILPAVLSTADLQLLNRAACPTRILPARRGARTLVKALHRSRHLSGKVKDYDAFSAQAVLVRHPARSKLDRIWTGILEARECGADSCLLDRRERAPRVR